jgi:NAD-dependent dihydropyrimidine dehydrogenase PreA subunit
MQRQPSGRVAIVNTDGCIGCGACQYICPATPDKAITVSAI